MNNYDTKRTQLTERLAEHGLKAESWETLYELELKLLAARAMDLKEDKPEFGRF